ncbi:GNAT family N-acetyltransferase [Asticcacaulis sp. SL142]|uniref:GNAT family N-acetyltransferase n=1 Tax=Asticcacaulis sp. SL142 TaxID=2995155 RepID=UPI00226CD0AC|nr:GNAT family N-acetyltransferase [Asticcacaulis sp. SL142]WAC47879.1 GNAT family N-acetyltransferase [Asticcacaulis sp. SL142]
MPKPDRPNYVIAPLDPQTHDRAAFSCGVEAVDNFFKKTASKLSKADNLRVFVMTDPEGTVIGFYALNAHAVDYQDLPKPFARTRPGHGRIPAAYISMIGRDVRFSGGGYGGDLLADALVRILKASEHLGLAVVILDVLDCGDPERVAKRLALYQGYGFQPLPSQPLRLFLPVATIRQIFNA